MNIPPKEIGPDAMKVLHGYSWKGNVRELENVIERAMILSDTDRISKNDLRLMPAGITSDSLEGISMEGTLEEASKAALKIVESRRIRKALDDTHGNKSKAAHILKVSYKTLLTKIKDYGIEN